MDWLEKAKQQGRGEYNALVEKWKNDADQEEQKRVALERAKSRELLLVEGQLSSFKSRILVLLQPQITALTESGFAFHLSEEVVLFNVNDPTRSPEIFEDSLAIIVASEEIHQETYWEPDISGPTGIIESPGAKTGLFVAKISDNRTRTTGTFFKTEIPVEDRIGDVIFKLLPLRGGNYQVRGLSHRPQISFSNDHSPFVIAETEIGSILMANIANDIAMRNYLLEQERSRKLR